MCEITITIFDRWRRVIRNCHRVTPWVVTPWVRFSNPETCFLHILRSSRAQETDFYRFWDPIEFGELICTDFETLGSPEIWFSQILRPYRAQKTVFYIFRDPLEHRKLIFTDFEKLRTYLWKHSYCSWVTCQSKTTSCLTEFCRMCSLETFSPCTRWI